MEPISFILCNFNAAEYFRFSYASLRRNLSPEHEIILLDDGSNDGSRQWLRDLDDPGVVKIENPENIGIGYSYNTAVDAAKNEHVCVLHTDMYVPPGFDLAMLRAMRDHDFIAAYRVEPSVYLASADKLNLNFGMDMETFDEAGFLSWNEENVRTRQGQTQDALFFPWMTTKTFYASLGGVDLLYLKYMIDDDDLYLRVKLSGARFAQVLDAAVYHFGSRSTRFAGDEIGEKSEVWKAQFARSERNFVRKWGVLPARCWTDDMGLVVHPKYDIGIKLAHADIPTMYSLEPFCSNIYVDDPDLRRDYVRLEQGKTVFPMADRVRMLGRNEPGNGVLATVPMDRYDAITFQIIRRLPDILAEVEGSGRFNLENRVFLDVRDLTTHEADQVVNTRCFSYAPGIPERGFTPLLSR